MEPVCTVLVAAMHGYKIRAKCLKNQDCALMLELTLFRGSLWGNGQ